MSSAPLHPVLRRGLHVGDIGTGLDGRHYRLVAPIQRGGMGELFLAEMFRDGEPPQRVVIKRLLADLQDEDRYIKMFRSEAAVMARLQHPNIVKLVDTPEIENAQCMAMEFVYGRNLQQLLHRHEHLERPIPIRLALTMVAQVLLGLHYAHTFLEPDGRPLKLVHRDVTPANVLVGYNGAVKLTDFGIAKSTMSLVSTTVGIVKGKARYLAPEQILGETATPRSDVFSAAVVTVELLTRTPLFERDSLPQTLHAIVHGERPDLRERMPDARPAVIEALERALTVDVRHRTESAETFAQQLLLAARDHGGPATRPELGGYLQGIFQDRVPLPPLGTGGDLPTIMGPAPDTPPDPLPRIPIRAQIHEDSPTDLGPPTEMGPEGSPRDDGPDASPTYILSGRAADADPRAPSIPSFDEAISALALVQRSKEVADPSDVRSPIEAPRGPRPTRPVAIRLPPRATLALVFVLGTVCGTASTLLVQRLSRPGEPVSAAGAAVEVGPAHLDVLYPRDAEVILDGRRLERRAPMYNVELPPGRHTLQVRLDDYRRNWSFVAHPGEMIEARRQLRLYAPKAAPAVIDGPR